MVTYFPDTQDELCQHNDVSMKLIYVNMQHNYDDMLSNYDACGKKSILQRLIVYCFSNKIFCCLKKYLIIVSMTFMLPLIKENTRSFDV